ncbi:DNA binding, HU-like domain [Streptomyces phage Stuff]|nr:HU-like domain DNA binding protein [Streptomyces phage Intolerant]UTN91842.1 DNA binding, HU-like domain [Streptomyces phage Stuff]
MKQFIPTHDLSRTSLGEAVAARMGVSLEQGHEAVFAVLDTVAKTLAGGYGVTVTNFGSWHPVVAPSRRAHNPQTMEPVTVPETFRVKWTTAPKLKEIVNGDAEPTIRKAPKG